MLARFTRFCSLFIAALVFWGLSFCKDYLKSLALQTSPFIPKTSKKTSFTIDTKRKDIFRFYVFKVLKWRKMGSKIF